MSESPVVLLFPTEVVCKITQGFGVDNTDVELLAFYRSLGYNAHNGWDIAPRDLLPPGIKPVWASDAGSAEVHLNDPTAGNFIVIQHTHGRTRYLHMHDIAIEDGAAVAAGQLLGHMGKTGAAEGVHLHWDYRPQDNNPGNGYKGLIDPATCLIRFKSSI